MQTLPPFEKKGDCYQALHLRAFEIWGDDAATPHLTARCSPGRWHTLPTICQQALATELPTCNRRLRILTYTSIISMTFAEGRIKLHIQHNDYARPATA